MLKQALAETIVVITLTALLIGLTATAGIPSRQAAPAREIAQPAAPVERGEQPASFRKGALEAE